MNYYYNIIKYFLDGGMFEEKKRGKKIRQKEDKIGGA